MSVYNTADTECRLCYMYNKTVKMWFLEDSKDRKMQDSGLLIKPPDKVMTENYNSELLKYTDRLFTPLHILSPFAFNAHGTMTKVMSL